VKQANIGVVEELALLVKGLSREELAQFREWFAEFDTQAWDQQIKADGAAGKVDRLIEESMTGRIAKKPRPL
jgi:hypothetical protein